MKKSYKYKQGIFTPSNPTKYCGTLPCIYRSSLELKLMRWLDQNSNVVKWGSESIIIPYMDPLTNRIRRYFVDNNVTFKDKEGKERKYLIEVKPASQCVAPVFKKMTKGVAMKQAAFVKNMAKWKAAQEWVIKKGYAKFLIITDKDLANIS